MRRSKSCVLCDCLPCTQLFSSQCTFLMHMRSITKSMWSLCSCEAALLAMLLNYFHQKDAKDKGCFLPEPQDGGEMPKAFVDRANSSVMALESSRPALKWKKATLPTHSATRRAEIGKYAAHHGPTGAARYFSKVCGHKVPESTARKFRDAYKYITQLKV